MPETKVLGPGGATKRPTLARVVRRLKIGAAVIVLGAGAYVYETGWLGWGYAEAVDRVLPSDEDLLGWIPIDEATVVVLDTHRFHFGALGPPDGGLRAGVGSFVSDFKKATGVDLAFQVDKVAIARTVAAARGRFDAKKIANRLAELHYMPLDRGEVHVDFSRSAARTRSPCSATPCCSTAPRRASRSRSTRTAPGRTSAGTTRRSRG